MRSAYISFLLITVAAAGFALGRFSGSSLDVTILKKEIPLFAPPPKTTPYETTKPSAVAAPSSDLVLETPVEGTVIDRVLEIAGRVRADGRDVAIIVRDGSGTIVAQTDAEITDSDPVTGFARFAKSLPLLTPQSGDGDVQVSLRGGDGLLGPTVWRPVRFIEPHMVTIKVFFADGTSADGDCAAVTPVSRTVSSKSSVYRTALESLLDGPTADEKAFGLATRLPSAVVLKSVAADGSGMVFADFSRALDRGVAGSCRVAGIRAQIEETLKQFPEVRGVTIAEDGRTEGILQP